MYYVRDLLQALRSDPGHPPNFSAAIRLTLIGARFYTAFVSGFAPVPIRLKDLNYSKSGLSGLLPTVIAWARQ